MPTLDHDHIADLVRRALTSQSAVAAPRVRAPSVIEISDVNQGRGVFSSVLRVTVEWDGDRPTDQSGAPAPTAVVVKRPALGPNGDAGRRSGAYRREAMAYRSVLPHSPLRVPHCYLIDEDPATGDASFVLEDLTPYRAVDQMDGLAGPALIAVASTLRQLHDSWQTRPAPDGLRTNTPTTLDPDALVRGLDAVNSVWAPHLSSGVRQAFEELVGQRPAALRAFVDAGPPTLCHGDPRADNLVFGDDWQPVIFDWQQIATQPGVADIAWLAATSATVAVRRTLDRDLIDAYGTTPEAYRAGFVLPGLAVLLLAQRTADNERTRAFIATSLDRIGSALSDWSVGSI